MALEKSLGGERARGDRMASQGMQLEDMYAESRRENEQLRIALDRSVADVVSLREKAKAMGELEDFTRRRGPGGCPRPLGGCWGG